MYALLRFPHRRDSTDRVPLAGGAALVLILAALIPREAASQSLGMWVWPQTAYATRDARDKLVRFCVKRRIDRLGIHVRFDRDNGIPAVRNTVGFADLLLLAERNNISIAAVRGTPRMFFASESDRTLAELGAIVAFNRALPAASSFEGIMYDVEPYLTNEWRANAASRRAVMLQYLNTLQRARSLLRAQAPGLWLAVDIPFWWDSDELRIEFHGEAKRFSEHVQDVADFVVLMSYRRRPGDVLRTAENEMRYARQTDKMVFLALEANPLARDTEISFAGLPPGALWDAVTPLLGAAQTDGAIGGLMLHSYRGLQVLPARDR